MRANARKRRRAAGFTPLEQVLSIAALLGCFVYPMSLAARAAGQRLAGQMDTAHKTLLTQRR
ncbi:hypothetical protein LVJ94_07805 [Pendulispora rubella]|uniref:Uncharacterized protein n=1 Tax=Pendulispora rubella TaxID=2741070 RepID=A0ABZ2LB50_9BACT